MSNVIGKGEELVISFNAFCHHQFSSLLALPMICNIAFSSVQWLRQCSAGWVRANSSVGKYVVWMCLFLFSSIDILLHEWPRECVLKESCTCRQLAHIDIIETLFQLKV